MGKITPAQARRILKKRTQEAKHNWDPSRILFPHQLSVFRDQSPSRVLAGTRQLGKSALAAAELIQAGLSRPGSESAYVDMDIEHGEKVVWREVDRLLEENNVPAKVVDGRLVFDNGSLGYIFSGEPSQVKKLQGLKFAILIIDESQEANAINDILTMASPALMRFNGRVLLMGIPGRVATIGPWWDICEGKDAGLYSQHRGHFRDNLALDRDAVERLFESEKIRLGEFSPDYLRHWCGQWPKLDNALRVYHYMPEVNGYDGDAPLRKLYSLGLDPGGVRDSEAVVVIGHGDVDGMVYAVDETVSKKREGGDWDDTGDRVGPLNDVYKCHARYYDYGSAHKDALTIIWQKDQRIVLTAVPSKDPYAESKRINALFSQRRLFIKRGSKLELDMLYTMWEKNSLGGGGKKPKYDGSYKQDAADAFRCAMWGVYGAMPVQPKPALNDADRERAELARLYAPPKEYRPTSTNPSPFARRRGTHD